MDVLAPGIWTDLSEVLSEKQKDESKEVTAT